MRSLINIAQRLLLLLLAVAAPAAAQEKPSIALRTFVKQDTVLLRWAPSSADLFIKGLENGYKIERMAGNGSSENNGTLQTYTIGPFSENKMLYTKSTDKNLVAMTGFTDELISSTSLSESTKNMAFSILMLSAGTNKDLAKMLGLYYEVILPPENSRNSASYRITLVNGAESSPAAVVNESTLSENQSFTTLTGSARPRLKQAYLSWEAKSLQHGYGAYWIERSADSVHFERRNKVPYLFLKSQDEPNKIRCDFVDTSVTEGQVYFYRITGINHFAETGKSSNIVKVYVPKSLYGECRIDTVFAEGTARQINGAFVEETASVPRNNVPVKFLLWRSDSIQYGYRLLAEQENLGGSFIFSTSVTVESGDRYYYKVAALSEDNDTVYSYPYYFFTLDQVPPSMPQNLAGLVNDSGIVFLNWAPNPENDIRGYRIFRSNDLKEEFTEVTKEYCTTIAFTDTVRLDNLTSTVYYRMVAVDLNFNNSESCAPVLLLKPDTIPPVEALFLDYKVEQTGVALKWVNSTSTDLAGNLLVRSYNHVADTLMEWTDTTTQFFDTTGFAGRSYDYYIVAADRSGNVSISGFLFVNYETGIRPGVSAIQSAVDRTDKSITINWTLPEEELYSVQVYRSKNDEPFRLVKTIRELPATSFIDKDLNINNTYHYKIKLIYANGVSSAMSMPEVVVY